MSRVYHTIRPMAARISSCPDVRVSGFRWWSDLWTHHPTEPLMCNFIEAIYLFANTRCYIQQTTEPRLNNDHISTIICEFSPGGPQRDSWPQRTAFLRAPAVCVYISICVYTTAIHWDLFSLPDTSCNTDSSTLCSNDILTIFKHIMHAVFSCILYIALMKIN